MNDYEDLIPKHLKYSGLEASEARIDEAVQARSKARDAGRRLRQADEDLTKAIATAQEAWGEALELFDILDEPSKFYVRGLQIKLAPLCDLAEKSQAARVAFFKAENEAYQAEMQAAGALLDMRKRQLSAAQKRLAKAERDEFNAREHCKGASAELYALWELQAAEKDLRQCLADADDIEALISDLKGARQKRQAALDALYKEARSEVDQEAAPILAELRRVR